MIKKSLIICFLLSLILIFISTIISCSNKNKRVKALTYPKSYSYVYEEPFSFNVVIYFNEENRYCDINEIDDFSIVCDDNKITVSVNDIKKGNKYKYDNESYYAYLYEVYIDEVITMNFEKAKFVIDDLSVEIGSLSLFNENGNNDLIDVTRLSCISDGVGSIGAIQIEISSKKDVVINNITISNTVFLDLYNSIEIYETYNENTNLSDLFYNYNQNCISCMVDKDINISDKKYLLIPLKFKYDYVIQSFPIIIKYKENNVEHKYVMDNFTFISSGDLLITQKGVKIYELNSLL